jgi:hypothetical protein
MCLSIFVFPLCFPYWPSKSWYSQHSYVRVPNKDYCCEKRFRAVFSYLDVWDIAKRHSLRLKLLLNSSRDFSYSVQNELVVTEGRSGTLSIPDGRPEAVLSVNVFAELRSILC